MGYKRSINCSRPKGFSQRNYCKRQKRGGKYKTFKEWMEDLEDQPFAVFVLAPVDGGFAATTRPADRGETGRIGLPGGKVDAGEDPVMAAKREAFEEGWDITIIDEKPFHKQLVEGKMVWWFKGFQPKMLSNFKESGRIIPIVATKEQISQSGYGNNNLNIVSI